MATEKTRLIPNRCDNRQIIIGSTNKSKECIVVIQRRASSGLDEKENYYGLTLEELLPYQSDPLWQNVRRAMLILFWAGLVLLLTLSLLIAIVEYEERCTVNSTKLMHPAPLSGISVTSVPPATLEAENLILST